VLGSAHSVPRGSLTLQWFRFQPRPGQGEEQGEPFALSPSRGGETASGEERELV